MLLFAEAVGLRSGKGRSAANEERASLDRRTRPLTVFLFRSSTETGSGFLRLLPRGRRGRTLLPLPEEAGRFTGGCGAIGFSLG